MRRKMKRKSPLASKTIDLILERELAGLGVNLTPEEQVAARLRAHNTLDSQADPELAWKLDTREIRKRIRASASPSSWATRHRLLTSVSTDSELLFLNRLYEMAKEEATHVYQWCGTHNPTLDEPIWAAGQLLNRAETRAYNALMQIGYDPDDRRQRVDLHTALVVQMVFHLIGLYKKG